MTLLYKSFRSLVAKRPPDSWTMGRKSGGITGRVWRTIHSGFISAWRKPSTTLSLFVAFNCFWPVEFFTSSLKELDSLFKSRPFNTSKIASAPIPAFIKFPAPYDAKEWYSSSPITESLLITFTLSVVIF